MMPAPVFGCVHTAPRRVHAPRMNASAMRHPVWVISLQPALRHPCATRMVAPSPRAHRGRRRSRKSTVVPARTDTVGDASPEPRRVKAAPAAVTPATRVVVGAGTFLEQQGIARVLEAAADIDVVAWGSSEGETLAAVEREAPDVVVVDVPMAPTYTDEGIRLARLLREEHPAIGVVSLSPGTHPDH